MCVLTRLQQTWTLVLKLPMCTVRKSVLIWSLYFSSSSKNAKKKSDLVPLTVHTCMHPYCYKLVTGLSIGDTTTREKVGAGNIRRLGSSASFPWHCASPGSEHGGLRMRQGLLHWLKNVYVTKIKKKTLQYLGHMGKLCWLLWEEHSTSSLPSLLSSRTPLKTTWDQLVMCSNNKEKTLTALKKRS